MTKKDFKTKKKTDKGLLKKTCFFLKEYVIRCYVCFKVFFFVIGKAIMCIVSFFVQKFKIIFLYNFFLN